MTAIADVAVRTSAVLAAGLLLRAVLAARSAALRHAVLGLSILGAAIVAPASLVVPAWTITLPRTDAHAQRTEASTIPAAGLRGPAPAGEPRTPRTPVPAAGLVWAAGFAIVSGRLVAGLLRLNRLAARSATVREAPWRRARRAIAGAYGLRREVTLLRTEAPFLLATCGVRRPCILLPVQARTWSEERIRIVLLHELAHVRRGDWLAQTCAQTILAALWFNPLLWFACRLMRHDSERACDDAVLARGIAPAEYATHLLALARECRHTPWPWAPVVPMASRSPFERRIAAMLNPRLDRTRLSRRSLGAVAATLCAVTISAAALRAAQGPAALTGTVYDTSGGVLPGVALTLQDPHGGSAKATTDAGGRFSFPGIGSGAYVLDAAVAGFRSLRQDLTLSSVADWDRALTLQIGDLQETITVRERRVAPAPAGSPAPQPIRVGGNIRAPRKLLDVHPAYPASMRDAGREGVVPIDAIIARDGSVASVRVLSAEIHPDFAVAAVDAVRQWRFSPTLLNGKPVEVVMAVSVRFSLSD